MGHRNPALASAIVLAGAGIVAQLSFAVALRAQKRAAANVSA
jgi:DHA1 family bicyclomycin/chloramphenicol resistance-like MFS transporter